LSQKILHSSKVAIIEIVSAILVVLALVFNAIKTIKMGKQYDELNLSARDYTLYVDVSARHRYDFLQKYA
jgi:hypothetical protein